MWNDSKFRALSQRLCREYVNVSSDDIYKMINKEIAWESERVGIRLTAKAVAGIQETVLNRCKEWATDKELHIDLRKLTSYDIASYRRSALYFRSLKKKGKSNAKKQKTD